MATRKSSDEGFTLIEVIVAVLVFAIISTGIVAGATTVIQMTRDNRSRISAANLASQELDTVRAISDVYSVRSVGWRDITVGDTRAPAGFDSFHLKRDVSWISASGSSVSCNNSTDLSFLQVNVSVKWDNMRSAGVVRDDTILSPTGSTSTSSKGAIALSVYGATGSPQRGVAVTVTPTSGGAPLAAQPLPTTDQGCTYANDVTPGTYSVKLARTGYLDDTQAAAPTKTITVTAGTTQSVSFTYDQAITLNTSYVSGPVAYSGSVAKPTDLPTSFLNTSGTYTTTSPTSSVSLFPFSSGYSAIAGPVSAGVTDCASSDPRAWLAGIVNGVAVDAGDRPTKGAPAGGAATVAIALGVVQVQAPSGATLTAVQAPATGEGNPGCGIAGSSSSPTLHYSVTGNGGWTALAVPYGSWRIHANGAPVGQSGVRVVSNTPLVPGVTSAGIVTLDPRAAR
jgi:prepilin-type N-terminal cleavage/methylation domain-containing protein